MAYTLITAERLCAIYDPSAETLTFTAWGTNQGNIHNIEIIHQAWDYHDDPSSAHPPLIRFDIGGFSTPIPWGTFPSFPYKVNITRTIPSEEITRSTKIIVFDALRKNGIVLDVQFLSGPEAVKGGIPRTVRNQGSAPPWATRFEHQPTEERTVAFGEMIRIFVPLNDYEECNSTCLYDRTMLAPSEEEMGGMRKEHMEWNFRALQTGETEIITGVYGRSKGEFLRTQITTIKIDRKDIKRAELPISWEDFVDTGIKLIQKEHRSAILSEILATSYSTWSTDNPLDLSQLKIYCVVKNRKISKTITIESTGWGSFGPVTISTESNEENDVLAWPVKINLVDAFVVFREEGYKGKVMSCSVKRPFDIGRNERDDVEGTREEAYFVFELEEPQEGRFIAVGAGGDGEGDVFRYDAEFGWIDMMSADDE